jgi:hypothetical protein
MKTMTRDTIEKIKEKILKDGSLSEERKIELLNLLTTMKPEVTTIKMPIFNSIHREPDPVQYRDRLGE